MATNRFLWAGIPVFALSLGTTTAFAEWRCDCTTIVDSCNASVAVRESAVEVTSDIQQCARVDYFIDGMPFVALVVGGNETQDWINRSEDPEVIVQSCQVCRDNAGETQPTLRRNAQSAEGGALTPLIEVQPDYPPEAAANGTEGHVELSFTVTPYGEVDDARVTASEPAGVFDQAAISALQRRRYPADESREPQTLNARFDFTIDDAVLSLRSPRPAAARAARESGGRPTSQCLRESAAYNYGEMVEVSLMNACAEPLVVYACGEGTGRNAGLWNCQSSEQSGSVLMPSGDSRIGSLTRVDLPEGSRAFESVGEVFLTRAPNSEYWSLACALDDGSCREAGRQWLRAIDRQPASVNPQDRTRARLSRSY